MVGFITDEHKRFYKSLFLIVTPMAIQNLITAAVHFADVLMLGFVGQTALAASSLAGQVQFVLTFSFSGISSGLIMLTAQYWGKKDSHSIETLVGIAIKLTFSVAVVFAGVTAIMPRTVMYAFTNDEPLIEAGAIYLRYVSLSYVFMSFSQMFQAVFKSIGRVATVTVITFSTLGINLILNACFIFGIGFFPKLGIAGVAIATTIARFAELLICLFISGKIKEIRLTANIFFRKNKILFNDFIKIAMPAVGNDFVWGFAMALYSVILGHQGEDIVAAHSVVGVIRNIAAILYRGMAYGGAILLGNEMGNGELERARRDASLLWKNTTLAGLLASVIIIVFGPYTVNIGSLNETATSYLRILFYINAMSAFGASVNTVLICGIFRAGGDSKFGFLVDTIIMWAVSIPIGLIAAYVLKLSPVMIYFILYLDEFEKMPFVVKHYASGKWLKNITREF